MIPFIGPLIGLAQSFLGKRADQKMAVQKATSEWEKSVGRSMENGWKDEYVTVVITFPLLQNFIGNLVYAFNGNKNILLAQAASMKQIGEMMTTPYGQLMMVVVLAAVGIKGIKALK